MAEDKVAQSGKEADMAQSDGKVESEPLTDEVKVKITAGDAKIEMGTKEGFTGLTKEELMVYAKDPYWVRLRWGLFILFWVVWLGMLVASIWIIVNAKKCPSPEPRQWYMKGPVYRVKVPLFKDSDGNAKGDLKGVEESVQYLVDTGVNSVWLSDFTTGKDVIADVGTIEDFKALIKAAHDRHLKVIVDVPSASVEDAKAWLDHNVDGVNVPTEDERILENVRAYIDLLHVNNTERTQVLLNDKTGWENFETLMGKNITDNNISPLVHFPMFTNLTDALDSPLDTNQIKDAIDGKPWPNNAWPNYALTGEGRKRIADRVGVVNADGMNMLLFLLPGTPFTYFGEEIAMTDKGAMMDWSVFNKTVEDKKDTHYSIYKKLALLRHQESILFGEINAFVYEPVFGLTRVKRGNPGYLLAINTLDKPVEADFSKVRSMSDTVTVHLQSIPEGVDTVATEAGSFDSNKVTLKPKQSVLFTFVPDFENKGGEE